MRNTETRRQQVMEYAKLYCERLGIESIPSFILDMKTYRDWYKTYRQRDRMPRIKHNLGRCFRPENTIWINLSKHKNLVRLRQTISHELVHIAYPSLPHGLKFESIVMSTVSGKPPKKVKGIKTETYRRIELCQRGHRMRIEYKSVIYPNGSRSQKLTENGRKEIAEHEAVCKFIVRRSVA